MPNLVKSSSRVLTTPRLIQKNLKLLAFLFDNYDRKDISTASMLEYMARLLSANTIYALVTTQMEVQGRHGDAAREYSVSVYSYVKIKDPKIKLRYPKVAVDNTECHIHNVHDYLFFNKHTAKKKVEGLNMRTLKSVKNEAENYRNYADEYTEYADKLEAIFRNAKKSQPQ